MLRVSWLSSRGREATLIFASGALCRGHRHIANLSPQTDPNFSSVALGGAPLYSQQARVVPSGMVALAVPDSEAVVSAIADAYTTMSLEDLARFHRAVAAKAQTDVNFLEDAMCRGISGIGGGGGAVTRSSAVSSSPIAASSSAFPADAASVGAPPQEKKSKSATEKSSFDVKLSSFAPEMKLKLIKELRAVFNLPLVEAKTAVESCPGIVYKGAGKDDAEKLRKAFESIGAKVEFV